MPRAVNVPAPQQVEAIEGTLPEASATTQGLPGAGDEQVVQTAEAVEASEAAETAEAVAAAEGAEAA